MKYKVNKYNYIIEYAIIGDVQDSLYIDIDDVIKENTLELLTLNSVETVDIDINFLEYQVIDGKLIHNIPTAYIGYSYIKPVYDGTKWIDEATSEEINIEIDRLVVEYMDMETERLKRVQFQMPISASLSKKIEDNIIRRIELQKPRTKEV